MHAVTSLFSSMVAMDDSSLCPWLWKCDKQWERERDGVTEKCCSQFHLFGIPISEEHQFIVCVSAHCTWMPETCDTCCSSQGNGGHFGKNHVNLSIVKRFLGRRQRTATMKMENSSDKMCLLLGYKWLWFFWFYRKPSNERPTETQ